MSKILQIIPPEGWRIGQTIFNFLEWLRVKKGFENNLDWRMADPFYIEDDELIKLYKEYLTTLQ